MACHRPRREVIDGGRTAGSGVKGHSESLPSAARLREIEAVKSTLCCPVWGPLPDLRPLKESIETDCPDLLILPALQASTEPVAPADLVKTRFGDFHKGSVLGVQQKLCSEYCMNIYDGVCFPDLPAADLMVNAYSRVLDARQDAGFSSISITHDEGMEIQELTTGRSKDSLWHKTRANRITASKVGRILSREDSCEKLAVNLKCTRKVPVKSMKGGLECEAIAAWRYVELRKNNVNMYPCGVVVSPTSPWLAATPDRKIYNPMRDQPFGLLEIKRPNVPSLSDMKDDSLKKDPDTGSFSLNEEHAYFQQVQMQLAVTGLPWCDVLFWTGNDDYHLQTVVFDPVKWQNIKDKLDKFYFEYFL